MLQTFEPSMASFQVRGAIQGTCYTVRAAGFVVSTALVGFGLDGPVRGLALA